VFTSFFEDLRNFIEAFEHKGEYHNVDHFIDVDQRFVKILDEIQNQHPGEITTEDYLLAKMFALRHDSVHNAHRNVPFTLSVKDIDELYGYSTKNYRILKAIKESLNTGIVEDMTITGDERPGVETYTEAISLSEEEMAAIVVDALAYKN